MRRLPLLLVAALSPPSCQRLIPEAWAQPSCGPDWTATSVVYEAHIEDFADCVVAGDWAPAFEQVQIEAYDLAGGVKSGITVRLACGRDYQLLSTLDVCTNLEIRGCGTGQALGGNTLDVNTATTGIKTHHRDGDCPFSVPVAFQPTFTMHNIGMTGTVPVADIPVYGIQSDTRVHIVNSHVRGFTQGLRMSCDVSRDPPSNCSLSYVGHNSFDLNEHAGVYVQGRDGNAITFVGTNALQNCRDAGRWNTILQPVNCVGNESDPECDRPCADFLLEPFLGVASLGLHTADARDVTENPIVWYPSLLSLGAGRSFHGGPYGETTPELSYGAPLDIILSGELNVDTSIGYRQEGLFANGLIFQNDIDSNVAELRLGRATNSAGAFFSMDNSEDNLPLRWAYDTTLNRFFIDVGGGGTRPIQIDAQVGGFLGAGLTLPGILQAPDGATLNFQNQATVCE